MANEFILRNGFLSKTNSIVTGSLDVSGSVLGNKFIKSGGSVDQFLKADGSVDGNTYITAADVPELVTFAISSEYHAHATTSTLRLSGSNESIDDIDLVGAGTIVVTQTGDSTFVFTSNDEFDGTVTSVGISNGGGLSVSNSPITVSGSITLTNTDRGSSQNIFKSIETTTGKIADDLVIVASSNTGSFFFQQEGSISVRTDSTTNTIIISGSDHTYTGSTGVELVGSDFRHVTSSIDDLSPAVSNFYVDSLVFDEYGHVSSYGTSEVPDSANTTYDISAEDQGGLGANILMTGSDGSFDRVFLKSGTNVSVTYVDTNTIEITSSDQFLGDVKEVTFGNGISGSGTIPYPTGSIIQETVVSGSIGSLYIGDDTLGVNLGKTDYVAASGNDSRFHGKNEDVGTTNGSFYIDGDTGPKIVADGLTSFKLMASDEIVYASLTVDNLTVKGTSTIIESDIVTIEDNIIILNSNASGSAPSEDAGIEIERGTLDNAKLIWNETSDGWTMGTGSAMVKIENTDHTHSSYDYSTTPLSGTTIFNDIEIVDGIVTGQVTTRELTLGDLGYTAPPGAGDGELTSGIGSGIAVTWNPTTPPFSANTSTDSEFTVTNTDKGSSQEIFKNVEVPLDDVGHTWSSSGTATADNNNDTIKFVEGVKIVNEISPTTDAVRISHELAPAPTVTGNALQKFINTIGVDTTGHIIGYTTGSIVANTDSYIDGSSYSPTDGKITLHRSGSSAKNIIIDLPIGSNETPQFAGVKLASTLHTYGENLDVDTGASEIIVSTVQGTYTSAFYDYVITNGSNSRAGTVISAWNGASVVFTDNSTVDIGDTSQVTFSVELNSGNVNLMANTDTSSNWIIKSIVRLL